MDELTKQVVQKTIVDISTSFQKGNYDYSGAIPNNLIEFSLMTDSEMGIFIGEVLESGLAQYASLLRRHSIPNDEKTVHIDGMLLRISEISNSVSSDDDQAIYRALSKLRLHVTQQQKKFPIQYKQLKRKGSFF